MVSREMELARMWTRNGEEKKNCGSFDHMEPEEQMAAVSAAMRHYFNSEDWIKARAKEFPRPEKSLARIEVGKTKRTQRTQIQSIDGRCTMAP